MARIVIEEPCPYETGVEHPGCDYLAHILCRKCGWVQGPHDCTVRRVLDPGSYVLIEKTGSIWPKPANDALLHWATTDRAVTPDDFWDALAGGEQP